MIDFGTIYICIISVSLPIALVTAVVLPHHGMLLIPQFDKFRNISCDISPERVHHFFTRVGVGSTGLFVAIVLGPIVVRSILRWRNRQRREKEQKLYAAMAVPAGDRMGGERAEYGGVAEGGERQPLILGESLIFGENPDYHNNQDSTDSIPRPRPYNTKPVQHLRVHSFDELPPPTMEDVTPPRSPWSYPASPVHQPGLQKSERRRSPFNPIVPGMKTMWEEGIDPVTGRKWRRKLVIYSGALGSFRAADGELRIRENDPLLEL